MDLPVSIQTSDDVKALFDYRDGQLFWKVKPRVNVSLGSVAGWLNEKTGYLKISYQRKSYLAHRLIFLYHHGYLPEIVDHIDNNQTNNQIENLRNASKSENGWNRNVNKNNKLGVKGVVFVDGGYRATICSNKKTKYLGRYKTLEQAKKIVSEARDKYHQEYARQ